MIADQFQCGSVIVKKRSINYCNDISMLSLANNPLNFSYFTSETTVVVILA